LYPRPGRAAAAATPVLDLKKKRGKFFAVRKIKNGFFFLQKKKKKKKKKVLTISILHDTFSTDQFDIYIYYTIKH